MCVASCRRSCVRRSGPGSGSGSSSRWDMPTTRFRASAAFSPGRLSILGLAAVEVGELVREAGIDGLLEERRADRTRRLHARRAPGATRLRARQHRATRSGAAATCWSAMPTAGASAVRRSSAPTSSRTSWCCTRSGSAYRPLHALRRRVGRRRPDSRCSSSPATSRSTPTAGDMTAADYLPERLTLTRFATPPGLPRLATRDATQTVFGEGPTAAELLFVGEQPGDQEDKLGRPFVGPARSSIRPSRRSADPPVTRLRHERGELQIGTAGKDASTSRLNAADDSLPTVARCRALRAARVLCSPRRNRGPGPARPCVPGHEQRGTPVDSPLADVVVATIHPLRFSSAPATGTRSTQASSPTFSRSSRCSRPSSSALSASGTPTASWRCRHPNPARTRGSRSSLTRASPPLAVSAATVSGQLHL